MNLRWRDDEPSWSPGERQIVFASNRANPATVDYAAGVYVMRPNGSGVRLLIDEAGGADSPSFSPDGRRIAFLAHTNDFAAIELRVVDTDGSGERILAEDPSGPAFVAPAWSPDGRLIAFIKTADAADPSARQDLWVVPADGGLPRRVAKGADSFAWAHTRERIAFGCFAGDVCIVGAQGGVVHRLTRMGGGVFEGTLSVAWSSDDKQIAFVQGSGGSYNPDYSGWVINVDGTAEARLPRSAKGTSTNSSGSRDMRERSSCQRI